METLRLYGIPAKYYQIATATSEAYDLYDDVKVKELGTYAEPIDIRVTFEISPSIKTLKSLGWYIKGEENLPIVAYVPLQYEGTIMKVGKDDIIEIVGNGYEKSRKFQIKDFKGQGFPNVVYWACNLVRLDVNQL